MLTPQEKNIFDKIQMFVQSFDMPEFPISTSKKIKVPYFTNVRVKDESSNITGTHKDRMAREIVQVYLDILKNKIVNDDTSKLPHFSIISAGSAALAIQTQLKKHNLPHLKILVDKKTSVKILKKLKAIGCEIHMTALGKKNLNSQDILRLTHNPEGFDITSNKGFDPDIRFYDWLAYEALNQNPDYIFIPFGTGQLYHNILNVAKNIITSESPDSVYTGNKNIIPHINFIGATTNNPNSKATKLYAPFRPFTAITPERIALYAKKGYCGNKSTLLEVSEKYITLAHTLLQKNKISAEYSGGVGLGLLYQIKNEVPRDSKILLINTGKAKI